jgi:magnesium-transporting ATPase (P-type)
LNLKNLEIEIENDNKIKQVVKSPSIFCEFIKLLRERGKIYARMKPNDKVELIKFLKDDKSSIVSMCGDGANDSGALMHADVGISIFNKQDNKIAAHFYSSEESISCIEHIFKNGRACYENTYIIYKFIIMYAIIQNFNKLLLLSKNVSDFSNYQYFYIDFFLVFISCLIASK